MTQRLRRRCWDQLRRDRRTAPRQHRPGNEVEAALSKLPNYRPIMLRSNDVRCFACDCLIELGHTAFTCQGHPHPAPVLCYNCGVGWCIYSGSHRVEDFDTLPAIGGPGS